MSLTIDQRLTAVEKKTFRLRLLCGLQATLLAAFWLSAMVGPRVEAQGSAPVLRVRGLVIEDSRGRPRVLLGAPFPQVRERNRQESTTRALVFLDEQGHAR